MAEPEAGAGRGQEKERNRKDEGRFGTAAERGAPGKATMQGKPKELSVGKAILMITQIGISMLAPIFVGGLIGRWLDRFTGAGFLFLIFLLFGFLAAFRNVYRLTRPFYADDLQREEQELTYWRELEQERKKNRAIAAGRESSAGDGLRVDSEGKKPAAGGSAGESDAGREPAAGGSARESDAGKEPAAGGSARADGAGEESAAEGGLRTDSAGTGVPPELDGVRARRLRAQLAELRREAEQAKEMPKDRRQEAEEEFDAWRKRNGGEQEQHEEDGRQ